MDEEAVIRLRLVDDADRAFRSTSDSIRRLQEQARSVMGQNYTESAIKNIQRSALNMGRSFTQQLEVMRNFRDAAQRQGQASEDVANRTRQAVGGVDTAVASVIGRYVTWAAAGEVVRRSFMNFANLDQQMRRVAVDAGVSLNVVRQLQPFLRDLSVKTGESTTSLLTGFNTLREFGNMSVEQTKKAFPEIAMGAAAMGVSSETMAKAHATLINNFKLSSNEIGKTNAMLLKASTDYKFNIQEALPMMGLMSEAAAAVGLTGRTGLATTLALVGVLKSMGMSGSRAAMQVRRFFDAMASPRLSEVLTGNKDKLMEIFHDADLAGKNTFITFMRLALLREQELGGSTLIESVLGHGPNGLAQAYRQFKAALESIGADINNMMNVSEEQLDRAFKLMTEDSLSSWQRMGNAFQEVLTELGKLITEASGNEILKGVGEAFKTIREDIEFIQNFIDSVKRWFGLSPKEQKEQENTMRQKFYDMLKRGPQIPSAIRSILGMSDKPSEVLGRYEELRGDFETKSRRFFFGGGGGEGGGGGIINRVEDFLPNAPMSTNIEDRRMLDSIKARRDLKENTEATARLTSVLERLLIGEGGVASSGGVYGGGGGIGGRFGYGPGTPQYFRGGGGRFGGAGASRSWGPGPGTGPGPGPGTGPGRGPQGKGPGGDGKTPSEKEAAFQRGEVYAPGVGSTGGRHPKSPEVAAAIKEAAKLAGIDEGTMRAIASIESDFDPNANRNNNRQYKGLYQLGTQEWNTYGAGGDRYNARDNALAAARLLKDHKEWFKRQYGRDPTDAELYMMHQQGRGFFTRGAMTNIAGNPYPGMNGPQTPASFLAGWGRALARRKGQAGPVNYSTNVGVAAPSDLVFDPNAPPVTGDVSGIATGLAGVVPAEPITPTSPTTGPNIDMQLGPKSRFGAPGAQTMEIVEYALRQQGLDATIFSGNRGAGRHGPEGSTGPAADLYLRDPITGQNLDSRIPADRAKIAKFIEDAAAAGGTGIGHGPGYMHDPEGRIAGIHVGGTAPGARYEGTWGAGGSSGTAPDWIVEAYARGAARRMTPQQVTAALKTMRDQQQASARSTSAGMPPSQREAYWSRVPRPPGTEPTGDTFNQRWSDYFAGSSREPDYSEDPLEERMRRPMEREAARLRRTGPSSAPAPEPVPTPRPRPAEAPAPEPVKINVEGPSQAGRAAIKGAAENAVKEAGSSKDIAMA